MKNLKRKNLLKKTVSTALAICILLVSWVTTQAAVPFAPAVYFDTGSWGNDLESGDFNGDGNRDILVLTNDTSGSYITFLGDGAGNFTEVKGSLGAWSSPVNVEVCDFNNDSRSDILVSEYNSNLLEILYSNGDGIFTSNSNYPVPSPREAVIKDFNNDSYLDVAVASYKDETAAGMYILFGKADSGDGKIFGDPTAYLPGNVSYGLTSGDFNNDGFQDLAYATYLPNPGGVHILLNDGTGVFNDSGIYCSGIIGVKDIAAGDLNNDGNIDLAVPTNGNSIIILSGNGNGTFSSYQYPVTGSGYVRISDLNNDGNNDVVVSNSTGNNIDILEGNGDDTFKGYENYPVEDSSQPAALVCDDFDNNGVNDIAVLEQTKHKLALFRNTCNDPPSSNPYLINLSVGGTPIPGFDPAIADYFIELPAGTSAGDNAAKITAVAASGATVYISQLTSLPGTATVIVTTQSGITAKVYAIYLNVKKCVLSSIGTLPAVTGVANGTPKSETALGLPDEIMLHTDVGDFPASISWDVASAAYDPNLKDQQTFTVTGTVTLPDNVDNNAGISLQTDISVTVDAETSPAPVNNAPAAINPLPAVTVTSGASINISASSIAQDADNDPLTITAIKTAPDPSAATAVLSGGIVTITGVSENKTAITVTVSDGKDSVDITIPINDFVLPIPGYPLTVTSGTGGTVTAGSSGTYPEGAVITITAVPDSGYSFSGWVSTGGGNIADLYSPTTTFTMPAGAATVTGVFTYNGSGSGSGGSNGGNSGNGGSGNAVNSGSNSSPNSNTSNSSTHSSTVMASVSGNNLPSAKIPVTLSINKSATVNLDTLRDSICSSDQTAVINVPPVSGAESYSIEIPAAALSGNGNKDVLTFKTDAGSIAIPGNMLSAMKLRSNQEAAITIKQGEIAGLSDDIKAAVGSRPIVQLTLTLDGKQTEWNNPNAPVTVAIPYKPTAVELENPEHIVVWYLDGNGNAVSIPNGHFDLATGTVIFTTSHFSNYAVSYVNKTFSDLSQTAWARKAIETMASKGIISGTEENKFSPKAGISRADFIVLLVKTLGLNCDINSNFDDVKPGSYYYDSVGIAKKLGITSGSSNNLFKPLSGISRQDMLVMTSRALDTMKRLQTTGDISVLDKFSDRENISDYAVQSLSAMVEEGFLSGDGDRLNPLKPTTRAEAAAILYKIYQRIYGSSK